MKNTTKGAIAAGLIVTSASIISYANTGASKKKNGDEKNSTKLVLDVEKVDSDTVKVSIDNITEVPKALQFSVKLEGNVALKEDESSIRDLINETVSNRKSAYATTNTVLTDYSYNSTTKEIDVLITSTNSLPKTGNKVDIFEMDIKPTKVKKGEVTKYKVIPADVKDFKYVSNTNKEYSNLGVSYEDKEITMDESTENKPGESIKPENSTPDKPEDTIKPEKPENKPGDSNESDKPEGEKPEESIKPEDSVPDKPEDTTKPEKPENKPGDSNGLDKPEGEKPGDATNQENPEDEEQTNPGNTDNEKPGDSNNSDKVEGGNQGNQSNDESTESGKKEEGTKPENEKQENEKEKLPKTGDKGLLGVISTGLVALGGLFIINKRKK